jgi:hypothetical protein
MGARHLTSSCTPLELYSIFNGPQAGKGGIILKPQPKIKLLERVRQIIRLKNYSYSTEKSYIYWIKRFIIFHNKRHPKDMGESEIEKFLSHLAVERNVAASTQNQALCSLVFLYKTVLAVDLDSPIVPIRAKRSKRLLLAMRRVAARMSDIGSLRLPGSGQFIFLIYNLAETSFSATGSNGMNWRWT